MPQPPELADHRAESGVPLSRRTVLRGMAAAPLTLGLSSLPALAGGGFMLHRGWVLRADDLERLGRK